MSHANSANGEGRRKVVDCLVHPVCPDRMLTSYLPAVWREYALPQAMHYLYPPPFGEYLPGIDPKRGDKTFGVVTPETLERDLFEADGVSTAVLVPLTRGMHSDPELDAAVATAVNEWLVERWLSTPTGESRFKGSIRVSPRNPARSVEEIRRWANRGDIVQVAVPLQATAPYGDPSYWPIWDEAAKHGLPIVVHADTGGGIESHPTAVGYPLTKSAMHVLQPLNAVIHLASLVAQGAFTRFPDLTFIFADGGFHAFTPIFWRFDSDFRGSRFQTPWVDKLPSEILRERVSFVLTGTDLTEDVARNEAFLALVGAESRVVFGSGYPFWDAWNATTAARLLPERFREAILSDAAASLYRLSSKE